MELPLAEAAQQAFRTECAAAGQAWSAVWKDPAANAVHSSVQFHTVWSPLFNQETKAEEMRSISRVSITAVCPGWCTVHAFVDLEESAGWPREDHHRWELPFSSPEELTKLLKQFFAACTVVVRPAPAPEFQSPAWERQELRWENAQRAAAYRALEERRRARQARGRADEPTFLAQLLNSFNAHMRLEGAPL